MANLEPQQLRDQGSPVIRWSITFFCCVVITLNVILCVDNFQHRSLSSFLVSIAILIVSVTSIAAVWNSHIAKRLLAGFFGIASLAPLVSAVFFATEPFFSTQRFTRLENPLNGIMFYLAFGIPSLLYACGAKKLLERYLVPGCLFLVLTFLCMITHAYALFFEVKNYYFTATYGPIALLLAAIAGRVLWQEWRDRKRGWRIGVSDFGGRSYEERLAGKWVSIDLPCVSDFREPPLQISIPGKKEWQNFPTWTEERHPQILDRILAVLESRERILIDADTNRTLHRDRHQER